MESQCKNIRELCPPPARAPHGRAAPGLGSSGLSASFIYLPVTHEHPLDDSHGDATFDVNAHLSYPVQIEARPQPRPTASQMAVISDKQERAAIAPTAGIPPHYLDTENPYPDREESPLQFIMDKQLRALSTNA